MHMVSSKPIRVLSVLVFYINNTIFKKILVLKPKIKIEKGILCGSKTLTFSYKSPSTHP